MEKETIEQIREKYNAIMRLNSLDDAFRLEYLVRDILALMIAGQEPSNDTIRQNLYYSKLNHTFGKEVDRVEYAYRQATKRNAAKVRTREYYKALADAKLQIRVDLFSLIAEDKD